MIGFIILLAVMLVVRYIEWKLFLKKLNNFCYEYDRKFVLNNVDNDYRYLVVLFDKDYMIHSEWSAYYFLFHKGGPDIYVMFFMPTILTLENIYDKELLDRVKNYK
jgi:hypothetical protein